MEAEQIIDQVDQAAEAVVPEVVEVVNTVKNNPYLLAGVALLGLGIGALVGYKVAEKKLDVVYEKRLLEELATTEKHYMNYLYKGTSPADMPARLFNNDDGVFVASVTMADTPEENDEMPAPPPEEELRNDNMKVSNIFLDGRALDTDIDYSLIDRSDEHPYLISSEEFDENEPDYEQVALSYYVQDDVVCGQEDEIVVEDVEGVLGEDNLTRFGKGLKNPNVLYIRNDDMETLYEVVKVNGKYAKLILGYDDDDIPSEARNLKFRNED